MAIKWDEISKNPDKNHKVLGRALLNQKKKIEELETKRKEFEEAKENINKMHDSMVSEIDSKDKIIEETKNKLETINEENESLQTTITDQEKKISNQAIKIKELEEKVKENINLTVELGQLKTKLEQNQSELQKHKDSESELSNELQKVVISESELKAELQRIKDAEVEQKSEISKYQEKEQELSSEIQNLKNEIDSLKEKLPIEEDKGQIENLQQEIENFKITADQNNKKIEELNQIIKDKDTEIESLKEAPAATTMPSGPVADMVPVKGKESAINTFQNLLNEAKSSVLIVAPDIKDIQDLPIQDLRQVIRIDIATGVTDKSIYDRLLEVRPSVRIRDNPHIDRWGIGIDGEKMFFAAETEDPIGFITTNRKMIDFVSAILTESWVRGRRL
ncbi:MAG: hypothetical protein HWN67_15000 [Candidatus Helarchaeota archaeon]|nr:hypothetical protein [Candidatus Helarchaeota archaeon]